MQKNLSYSLRQALPATVRSASWLLKLMIPVSLLVTLLQHFGVLERIAVVLNPVFSHLGLPGASSVTFISGAAAGTYAGIAAMMSMPLSVKEATVLSLMIALCHALPMECAVNRKTGSSFWKMCLLRILMAFLCASVVSRLLPDTAERFVYIGAAADSTFTRVMLTWLLSQLKISAVVFLIIYSLMVVQRLIEAYSLLQPLSTLLAPLMRLFGLPPETAYMWLVGNVLGISYGSAVMVELEERGIITRSEANDVNYHLIMNHSLLEDTIVFALVGISAPLLVGVRVVFAMMLVWSHRLCRHVFVR